MLTRLFPALGRTIDKSVDAVLAPHWRQTADAYLAGLLDDSLTKEK